MLETLRDHHHRMLHHLQAMRRLIGERQFAQNEVAHTRLQLGKASSARVRFLSEIVYPALLSSLDEASAEPVRRLWDDANTYLARSSMYVGKWTNASIAADWQGYQRASADFLTTVAERIARERAVLYPLLVEHERRASSPSARVGIR
jgi:hypothetical protein